MLKLMEEEVENIFELTGTQKLSEQITVSTGTEYNN